MNFVSIFVAVFVFGWFMLALWRPVRGHSKTSTALVAMFIGGLVLLVAMAFALATEGRQVAWEWVAGLVLPLPAVAVGNRISDYLPGAARAILEFGLVAPASFVFYWLAVVSTAMPDGRYLNTETPVAFTFLAGLVVVYRYLDGKFGWRLGVDVLLVWACGDLAMWLMSDVGFGRCSLARLIADSAAALMFGVAVGAVYYLFLRFKWYAT